MAQLGNHVFEYTRNGKRRLAGSWWPDPLCWQTLQGAKVINPRVASWRLYLVLTGISACGLEIGVSSVVM